MFVFNNIIIVVFIKLCLIFPQCSGREPVQPRLGTIPFMVYYSSRYRGICSGTLVSKVAVLSAAVCVLNPNPVIDTRSINMVMGTIYRHSRRGVRIQVIRIVTPRIADPPQRMYDIQRSAVLLLLKHGVPDILSEFRVRPAYIDYKGEEILSIQDECFMLGWHYFYRGEKIYPVHKFLLQRHLRLQFINIVKKSDYCEPLTLKFRKTLIGFGYTGVIDSNDLICIRDPDKTAQTCHGMYGSPLYCRSKVVAMLMAPDAQWTNCTGYSNILTLLTTSFLRDFFACVEKIFKPDFIMDWEDLKWSMYEDIDENMYDYVPALYDKMVRKDDESSGDD